MRQTYLYGALALGLLFTSCSSDNMSESSWSNLPLDAEQTFYVSLKISGDETSTRSSLTNGAPLDTDFENGSSIENQVHNAFFVFYDENGNVVGDVVPVDLPEPEETAEGNTVEKSYKSVVSVSVRKGEKKPSQVICYINPIQSGSLNVSLNTIQTVARQNFSTGTEDKQYFAMSNSVYYPEGEAPTSEPVIAVQIPSTQLYTSESAAEKALESNNFIEIYVERYATKLTFDATTATSKPYATATRVYNVDETTGAVSYVVTPVSLSFTPKFWAVNAQANRTYVIKSFRQESEDGILLGSNYKYGALNNIINQDGSSILNNTNYWDWNNPDYHRSYWGMSPAYFTATYPEVSSDIMGEDALEVNQKYISYNELASLGFEATVKEPKYFRETTVGSKALNANNPAAAVASVIYVGQYGVSVNNTTVANNPGFYTYLTGPVAEIEDDRPYVYFENDNQGNSKVSGGESMLRRFLVQASCFYKAVTNEGSDETSYVRLTIANQEDLNTLVNALKVDTISEKVKIAYDGNSETKLKLQANARTLQFKDVDSAGDIYLLTGNGYQQVVSDDATPTNNQITFTQANLAVMRQVGYAYYYTTGHAYFNIPVKHLGWYRVGNTQKNNDKIDWSKVRVGDFGMVRNHTYSINVSEIYGLASGIGDDNVPIVPPATTEDYFVAYSVRILKWAMVPTQGVNL